MVTRSKVSAFLPLCAVGGLLEDLVLRACTVDMHRGQVCRDGKTLRLTTKEVALLAYLVARPDALVSRDALLAAVWGYSEGVVSRAVDTTIRRLRTKIERDPKAPDHVLTVYGEGYRFVPWRTSSVTDSRPMPGAAGPARAPIRPEVQAGSTPLRDQSRRTPTLDGEPAPSAPRLLKSWPVGSRAAEAVLVAAGRIAESRGFFGVEHLLDALADCAQPTPWLSLARRPLQALLQSLPPLSPGGGRWQITPRLEVMGKGLDIGFGLDDLLSAVVGVPWVGGALDPVLVMQIRQRDSMDTGSTLQLASQERPRSFERSPGTLVLEVLGGPEDGRQITLSIGQTMGRWHRSAPGPQQLFVDGAPADRYVSRHHLKWLGQRRLDVLDGPSRHAPSARNPVDVRGEIVVSIGDVLWVGVGTRLEIAAFG